MPSTTFMASYALRDALELEAFEHDETISATLRRIVTNYLRHVGKMSHLTAPSPHLHDSNRHYRDWGDA